MVVKQRFTYEKSNVIERCSGGRKSDLGFVLQHAGNNYDHNPSDHGRDSPGTGPCRAHDDNYDAHGRRLLIVKIRRGRVCCSQGSVGHPRIQTQH
jgi:hypothetical protein